MLSFFEARQLLLERVEPLDPESVALGAALGRVLARALIAPSSIPAFSASAMDGYAVGAASLSGASSWELEVIGESRTGRAASPLVPGSAQQISTGAEMPAGADAVIPRELIDASEGRIRSSEAVRPGQHVRQRGEDLQVGERALAAGTRLGAAALGLAASLDQTELAVARRPRVTILCTGDELRPPGSAAVPGKIPDSISIALAALAQSAGAVVTLGDFVADEREATSAAIAQALNGADLLLTVGGVSVGDHDWVRPALEGQGVELSFWKVAIKPGKPIAVGRRSGRGPWVMALPGNPASALITFALFGLPLLRALQGDGSPLPAALRLPLGAACRHKLGRLEFSRARLVPSVAGLIVLPLANQASGALTSLAWCDALALLPAEQESFEAGSLVDVLRIVDL